MRQLLAGETEGLSLMGSSGQVFCVFASEWLHTGWSLTGPNDPPSGIFQAGTILSYFSITVKKRPWPRQLIKECVLIGLRVSDGLWWQDKGKVLGTAVSLHLDLKAGGREDTLGKACPQ